MNFKIKPFEVSVTDNLGLGSKVSYIASEVSAVVEVREKVVGSTEIDANIIVSIYEQAPIVEDDELVVNRFLNARDVRRISANTLEKAGLTPAKQKGVFKALLFGTEPEQLAVVESLISTFGLELDITE